MKTKIIKIDQNTVEIDGEVYVKQETEWPQEGDEYWFLYDDGDMICNDEWCFDGVDIRRRNIGNIFRTEAEAVHERERLKLMTDLREYADFKPDWGDWKQTKFRLVYGAEWEASVSWNLADQLQDPECNNPTCLQRPSYDPYFGLSEGMRAVWIHSVCYLSFLRVGKETFLKYFYKHCNK